MIPDRTAAFFVGIAIVIATPFAIAIDLMAELTRGFRMWMRGDT